MGMEFYIDAFYDLGTERQTGFGIGPIPVNSIYAYASHIGLAESDTADLLQIVRALDAVFLEKEQRKAKRKKKK